MFRTYIETTETNRSVSKQTKTTLNFQKNTKICSLSTVSVGLPYVSAQWKHRNSLFQYRSETNCFKTNWNKAKQIETTLNFLKKYQNMLSIKLFWLTFCLLQFNQKTKTLCFGTERNNRNKRFVSVRAKTSFGSSFGCFECFEGHSILDSFRSRRTTVYVEQLWPIYIDWTKTILYMFFLIWNFKILKLLAFLSHRDYEQNTYFRKTPVW